jgi:hypothetical protein
LELKTSGGASVHSLLFNWILKECHDGPSAMD